MEKDRGILIEEEIQACRGAWEKMRSILYKAVMKGTKNALERGCLQSLSALDHIYPIGRRFHGDGLTFSEDSGHAEE